MKRKDRRDARREAPPPEDFYDDWSAPAEDVPMTPEELERYYARRDAYYAQRDAYYAQRDAYYARQERRLRAREEELQDWEEEPEDETETDPESAWDYIPEDAQEVPAQRRRNAARRRRRRRGRFFRRLLTLLLALLLALPFLGKAPLRQEAGRERVGDRATILLAGTDREGLRTDTILLLSLDRRQGSVRLLSIPRDTYAPGYGGAKINAVYGAHGGGKEGMEALLRQARTALGFTPDAYALVDMALFEEATDLLGGLDYNVPMDMHYEDWTQDLLIDLRAGQQHLNGHELLGLVRFRSGYANADIGRTEVQREVIREAVRQWVKPASIPKLPELWQLCQRRMVTDLSFGNLLWLARVLLKTDPSAMETEVLPGWADMAEGSSVYMVDRGAAEAMMPRFSPYGE